MLVRVEQASVRLKSKLLCGALGLALFSPSGIAHAQDAQGPAEEPAGENSVEVDVAGAGLNVIIVSAQKRDEMLLDTPIAVSAVAGDELDRRGISSLQGIEAIAPNISVGQQNGVNRLYIRGVGLSAYSTGSDPSTAFHVNGVVIGRGSAQLSSFYDVERIEVLRGPQGTLYGRNATAGSVNLITRMPTRDFSAYLDTTVGNYGHFQFQGAVSGSLDSNGDLSARLAFQTIDHDGYGENVTLGTDIDNQRARALRGTLLYDPGNGFEVLLTADYATEDDRNYSVYSFGPFIPGSVLLGEQLGGEHIVGGRQVASDILPINDRYNWGLSAAISVDVGDRVQLRSITGYRKFRRENASDVENTSSVVASFAQIEESEQFSQELQLLYDGDRIQTIFGLYYYNEDLFGITQIPLNAIGQTFNFPDAHILQVGTGDIEAFAAFGQFTWEFVDSLSLTAGLRYSWENRSSVGSFEQFNFNFPAPANVGVPAAFDETYDAFTPRFALEFRPQADVLIFASATRGFKSGVQVLGNTNPPVDPEFIWSYEAGVKATLIDRKLELALTGFIYDYTDLQINRPQGLSAIVVNAASARIKGLEFESRAAPVDGLTLNLNISYLDAKFTDFPTFSPVYGSEGEVNLAGNRLSNAPEWSFNAGIEYVFPISMPGELSFRGDLKYVSQVFFTEYNDGSNIVFPTNFTYTNDVQSQSGVTTMDASIRYVTESEWLSVTVFGRNLTNELIASNNIVGIAPFGFPVGGSYKPPRTYGMTIGVRY